MFLKNENIIFKIRRSKVTDYAALRQKRCYIWNTMIRVTYDHFYSLQQAKVILFLLKEALWQTVKTAMNCRLKYDTTFHQSLRTFQRKALHFGNKQKL